jgi:hypothetical protein
MMNYVLAITIALLVFAGLFWLARSGFRNGDGEGDARVRAVLRPAGQPGEQRRVRSGCSPARSGLPTRKTDPKSAASNGHGGGG